MDHAPFIAATFLVDHQLCFATGKTHIITSLARDRHRIHFAHCYQIPRPSNSGAPLLTLLRFLFPKSAIADPLLRAKGRHRPARGHRISQFTRLPPACIRLPLGGLAHQIVGTRRALNLPQLALEEALLFIVENVCSSVVQLHLSRVLVMARSLAPVAEAALFVGWEVLGTDAGECHLRISLESLACRALGESCTLAHGRAAGGTDVVSPDAFEVVLLGSQPELHRALTFAGDWRAVERTEVELLQCVIAKEVVHGCHLMQTNLNFISECVRVITCLW